MGEFRIRCDQHGLMTGELCTCALTHAKVLQAMLDMEWHGVPATIPCMSEWLLDVPQCVVHAAISHMIINGCVTLDARQGPTMWGVWALTNRGRNALMRMTELTRGELDDIFADHLLSRSDWASHPGEGADNG